MRKGKNEKSEKKVAPNKNAYIEGAGIVENQPITDTLTENYMPYAMSVIVSRALPEIDGFTLCKEIRRYSDVPIMFITARTSEADMLNGYALGCDDYIVKPIALPVFYEKVKALIKRSKGLVRHNLLTVGNVSLNPNNGVVVSDGEEVTLTAKEYAILKILLENKNSVVSREKIITAVWHYDTMIDERVLDTHIKNIRKALGENASVLKTVIRRGYKAEDKK